MTQFGHLASRASRAGASQSCQRPAGRPPPPGCLEAAWSASLLRNKACSSSFVAVPPLERCGRELRNSPSSSPAHPRPPGSPCQTKLPRLLRLTPAYFGGVRVGLLSLAHCLRLFGVTRQLDCPLLLFGSCVLHLRAPLASRPLVVVVPRRFCLLLVAALILLFDVSVMSFLRGLNFGDCILERVFLHVRHGGQPTHMW